jgi:nicotinamidase-related amidase
MKTVLGIVDLQNDFLPGGSLAVFPKLPTPAK